MFIYGIQNENVKFILEETNHSVLFGYLCIYSLVFLWSGGAMMMGKLPVPGRLTNLDNSRARET